MAFSTWSVVMMAVQICTRLSFTIRLRTRGRLSKPLWKRLEGNYRVLNSIKAIRKNKLMSICKNPFRDLKNITIFKK